MKAHLDELAERRERLQQKIALQRQEFGLHMSTIDTSVRAADRSYLNVKSLLQKPVLLVGGVAVTVLLGPRRLLRYAGRATLVVSALRRLIRIAR